MEFSQISSEHREELCQLQAFNNEISRLHAVLGRLMEARNGLVERIVRREAVLSVIRRVPVEIWQMIFTWVGASREYSMDFMVLELSCRSWPPIISIPHNLSHVCKIWKRIVGSLPVLWSSLRVKFSKLQTDIRPLLTEYLEKSRRYPLKISCADLDANGYPAYESNRLLSAVQEECFLVLINGMCEELEYSLLYHIREPPQHIELPIFPVGH